MFGDINKDKSGHTRSQGEKGKMARGNPGETPYGITVNPAERSNKMEQKMPTGLHDTGGVGSCREGALAEDGHSRHGGLG